MGMSTKKLAMELMGPPRAVPTTLAHAGVTGAPSLVDAGRAEVSERVTSCPVP